MADDPTKRTPKTKAKAKAKPRAKAKPETKAEAKSKAKPKAKPKAKATPKAKASAKTAPKTKPKAGAKTRAKPKAAATAGAADRTATGATAARSTAKRGKARAEAAAELPSPEDILDFIAAAGVPVGKREIARAFKVKGALRSALKDLLRRMEEEGLLERGEKRSLRRTGDLPPVAVIDITGRDPDGELIARPASWRGDTEPPSIVIAPAGHKDTAIFGVGDRVLARLTPAEEDFDYEARVIRKLGAGARRIMGVLHHGPGDDRGTGDDGSPGGDWILEPVDKRERGEYRVARGDANGAGEGDLVEAELLRATRYGPRRARVVRVFGPVRGASSISLIAIHEQGLPTEFSERALAEAEAARPASPRGRTDLRDIPLITIDPADARDHDDAVWAAPDEDPANPGGHHVIVAIADVAAYVLPGSGLDTDAWQRGNSAYFPDRVVPMLPERISNDLCSLVPGEDRACIAVRMTFDAQGRKRRHEFTRAIMRSAAKLSYQQVQAAMDGTPDDVTGPLLDPVIRPLYAAFAALERERERRQPLDLDLPERKIVIGPDGRIESIHEVERLDSMRLIESFMIAANVSAAETLEARHAPLIYRVHDAPPPEKLKALADFLATLDIPMPRGAVIKPGHLNRILRAVADTEQAELVSEVVLRSMAQAEYSTENIGHFGLNLARYTHFTSPIRRYADLTVHRTLIRALKLGPAVAKTGLTDDEAARLSETAEHISQTERRAEAAERASTDRYLAEYLSDRVGAEFEGRISGVTRFGLFVRLSESGADGLIPIASLEGDYFHHVERLHALVGERTGMMYRLGDRVRVRLVDVAPLKGGLLFELLEGGRPASKAERRHAREEQMEKRRAGPRGRNARQGGRRKLTRQR